MHQIAEAAGVSTSTVSNEINGSPSVRENLRLRVLGAIHRRRYQPNQLYLRSLLPAGLLIISAVGRGIPSSLAGPPMVCLYRLPRAWKGGVVVVANHEGTYEATKHLIRMGHRQIAIITGPLCLTNALERAEGFRSASGEAGTSIDPEYVQEGHFDRASGYAATVRLLRLLARPTVIFASNDLMAFGAFSAERESKLHCPEDVSLVGFDGLDATEFSNPPLTTVYQPGYHLGKTAARVFLERIRGKREGAREILLRTGLKIRNSVASLNAGETEGKTSHGLDNVVAKAGRPLRG